MSPLITTRAGASANAYGWGAASAIPGDYESIATVTVPTTPGTILTFSSIPTTYTHLELRFFIQDNGSGSSNMSVRFNNSGGTAYSAFAQAGSGSVPTAASGSGASSIDLSYMLPGVGINADTWGGGVIRVWNYKNTSMNKTLQAFGGYIYRPSYSQVITAAGYWNDATTINRIDLLAGNAWRAGSSCALYGIK